MCRVFISSVIAILLPIGVLADRIGDARDQATILNVAEPITIQGTMLAPGQYEFRLMTWTANREVVRIFDSNGHLVATKMAWPIFRTGVTNDTRITFYEYSRGEAPAVRTWFSPGYHYGFRFAEK